MINLTREEAQQVLDAFLGIGQRAYDAMSGDAFHECSIAVSRLRARIAQPEPEPVAWQGVHDQTDLYYRKPPQADVRPLYTAPPQPEPKPVADKYLMEVECTKCGAKQDGVLTVTAPQQRNWQGLTDEEMFNCLAQTDGEAKRLPLGFKWFAEAIEAKLKEKNNGA